MGDLVSISDAAKMLSTPTEKLTRSSLSRYVTRYADALNPVTEGRKRLVDIEILERHRQENVNIETPAVAPEIAPASDPELTAKRRRAEADASLKEIELERALGSLCPVSEVEAAAREAVSILTSKEANVVAETAEAMAAKLGVDAPVLRSHLKEMARRLRVELAAALIGRVETITGQADHLETKTKQ